MKRCWELKRKKKELANETIRRNKMIKSIFIIFQKKKKISVLFKAITLLPNLTNIRKLLC